MTLVRGPRLLAISRGSRTTTSASEVGGVAARSAGNAGGVGGANAASDAGDATRNEVVDAAVAANVARRRIDANESAARADDQPPFHPQLHSSPGVESGWLARFLRNPGSCSQASCRRTECMDHKLSQAERERWELGSADERKFWLTLTEEEFEARANGYRILVV